MNGWLTIKTRLLTGSLKNGLKDITKYLGSAKSEVLALIKSFAKVAIIVGTIMVAFNIIAGGLQTLLARNEELSNKIQAIKLALSNIAQSLFTAMANLLEPVITRIVDWIYKLMAYLNVITKDFFGIDLFAQKTNKSLKGSAKSAKDIKKSLAGFDELNILTQNVGTSGGGGSTGGTEGFEAPKIDTTAFEEFVKKFKKTITKLKDKAVEFWDFILNTSHEDAKKYLDENDKTWGTLKLGMFDWLHGVSNIVSGFYDVWSGIFDFLVGLFTGDDEKVEKGVKKMVQGVIKILEGLWSVLRSNPEMIWGIIKGIGLTIWEFVKDKVVDKIKKKIKEIWKQIKDDFKESWWKGILNVFITIFNKIIDKINDKLTISVSKTLAAILRGLGVNVQGGKYSLFTIPHIPKLARGGIVNNPGRGVNMGSYIAGEKGSEAIIPLTDDTLQKLANMIPITIDLTNTIDGRVLNRRLETIRANDMFARNGVR